MQAALPRLVGAGLVTQGDGFEVSLDALRAAALLRPERNRGAADATPDEQRILRNFVVDGRLTRLPARHAQRQVVLGYVARRFDEGRDYGEREVNGILLSLYPDAASLRRYLVDAGWPRARSRRLPASIAPRSRDRKFRAWRSSSWVDARRDGGFHS